MYRVYDKPEAIRSVQRYLRVVADPNIQVIPTGVYDENTRLSVLNFQSENQLNATGEVDYNTFEKLYSQYVLLTEKAKIDDMTDSFIGFPLLPGDMDDSLMHINRSMKRILDYYGFTNRLTDSNFYSLETAMAVDILRSVYLLDKYQMIDEIFYKRMIDDHNSIRLYNNNSENFE